MKPTPKPYPVKSHTRQTKGKSNTTVKRHVRKGKKYRTGSNIATREILDRPNLDFILEKRGYDTSKLTEKQKLRAAFVLGREAYLGGKGFSYGTAELPDVGKYPFDKGNTTYLNKKTRKKRK